MENRDIRLFARGAGVPLWRIAQHLHVSEMTITRWLRMELSAEKREKIMTAIQEIKNNSIQ